MRPSPIFGNNENPAGTEGIICAGIIANSPLNFISLLASLFTYSFAISTNTWTPSRAI